MNYIVTKNSIDPFVNITQLYDGVFSFIARSPGFGGDARIYLICGTEKALVIDTGFGIGNLKGLIEYYTKLPYDVVNTHFHGDHVGGNSQFERIFIHELDYPTLVESEKRPPYDMEIARDTFFTKADVIVKKPYEIIPIKTGYEFDLGGGHVVEVLHTPGHSAGGISLLEKKRRMLFSGDAIVFTPIFMFGFRAPSQDTPFVPDPYTTIEEYRDSLLVLRERKGEFDGIYPGHHNMNLSTDYVDDLIGCCEDIMADPSKYDDTQKLNFGEGMKVKLRIHGNGIIAFSDEKVYKARI